MLQVQEYLRWQPRRWRRTSESRGTRCELYWLHDGMAYSSVSCREVTRTKEVTSGSGIYRRKKDCEASVDTGGAVNFGGFQLVGCTSQPTPCRAYSYIHQESPGTINAQVLTENDSVWGSWRRAGHYIAQYNASAYGGIKTQSRVAFSFKGECGGKVEEGHGSASIGGDWKFERQDKYEEAQLAAAHMGSMGDYACTPTDSKECTDACRNGDLRCSGDTVQACEQLTNSLCYNWANRTNCADTGQTHGLSRCLALPSLRGLAPPPCRKSPSGG